MMTVPSVFVKRNEPEMDRGGNAIIRATADQIIREHLKVKHAHADDSVYPIMSRLVKASNDAHSLSQIVAFCTSVAKALPALLAPVLSSCTEILQIPSLPIPLNCFCEIGVYSIYDKDPLVLNNRGGSVQQPSGSQRTK
jgi:hypothetical protein